MKCQTCMKNNDPGRRFCAFCGSHLKISICQRCSFVNDHHIRFCGGCGLDLKKRFEEMEKVASSSEEDVDLMKYSLKDVMFDVLMDKEKEKESQSRKLEKIDQATIKKLFKKRGK